MSCVKNVIEFNYQPGKQEEFLRCSADIVIYGGAAGGGKTFGLLLKAAEYYNKPDNTAVIFRRLTPTIKKPGGIWEASRKIYIPMGGKPNETELSYKWHKGLSLKFSHMQYEHTKFDWAGTELAFIGWEELTEFERSQFVFMFSRARSTTGLRPQIAATTNPQAGSWVLEFIGWYIDPDTGYAIAERSGKIRWFVMLEDKPYFADTRKELLEKYPDSYPLSLCFISSSVYDNKVLMDINPAYEGMLKGMPKVERERLLYGNWKITPAAGNYFKREYFRIIPVEQAPTLDQIKGQAIRIWDLAGTKDPSQVSSKKKNRDPDWTVGMLMMQGRDGYIYIRHVTRFRESPLIVEERIKNIASLDGKRVKIIILHDPGQAGNYQVENIIRNMIGYNIRGLRVTKDKITMAGAASAQAERGNIILVEGKWNETFLHEVENFPEADHDDQVDPLSNGVHVLANKGVDYEAIVNY